MAKTTQRGSCETCTYYTYDEEYENYVYKYIKRSTYLVNDDFPRVRLNDLSDEIVKVSYEILLKDIERFKKKVY